MVEPTKERAREDAAAIWNSMSMFMHFRWDADRRVGNARTEPHMWARPVVTGRPTFEQPPEMSLIQWKHEIQALSRYGTDQSLAQGIRLWTLVRRLQHFEPQVCDGFVEVRGENAVPIVDEESINVVRGIASRN